MQGVQVRSLVGDSTYHVAWPKDKKKIKLSSHHVVPGTSQVALLVKNLPANAGDARDMDLIPGSGRSPGEENGNPFQYSCLESPMDGGTWWAIVRGVPKSWTLLSN